MRKKKIMFVGLGQLGTLALDMFLRNPHAHEVFVTGRNAEKVQTRANLSALLAIQLGFNPDVTCLNLDVNDIEKTAETIFQLKPDIIFNSASLQSWNGITSSFPPQVVKKIAQARRGSWLPMSLTLIYKLMQAVKQTGLPITVINASYPDVINPMLMNAGLGPQIGIGNVANCIPALRSSLSFTLQQPLEKVTVLLFAPHAWSHKIDNSGETGKAPFHLTVLVDGDDWTDKVDFRTAFDLMITKFNRPGGLERTLMTAASAVTIIDALAYDKNTIVHAPGPNGLPGGYPVRINNGQISIELPPSLSLKDAIRINEECQRFDGIELIDESGSVYFTDEEVSLMEETFGYKKKKMSLAETESCAQELTECWDRFVSQIPQAV